jgi:leucyl/phenylalanyl-tRNA---protein transferase
LSAICNELISLQSYVRQLLSRPTNPQSLIPRMPPLPPSRYFPPAESANAEGIIGFGGKLTPNWILDAYSHGIFPWPMGDIDWPMCWWSPDPRAIIEFERFHVSRRLQRTCQSGHFTVTLDRDFAGVIRGCGTAGDRRDNTWLTKKMINAYIRLHRLGHAHSVEVWQNDQLVGGTYGVSIGGFFAAESMFHHIRDASKVALVHLLEHLKHRSYDLLDIQILTPHTARFGAIEIPRSEYLARLAAALNKPIFFAE